MSEHPHQLSDIIKQGKGSLQTEGSSAPVYSWSAKGYPLDSWQAPSRANIHTSSVTSSSRATIPCRTEGSSAPVYSWSAKGYPLDSWQARKAYSRRQGTMADRMPATPCMVGGSGKATKIGLLHNMQEHAQAEYYGGQDAGHTLRGGGAEVRHVSDGAACRQAERQTRRMAGRAALSS